VSPFEKLIDEMHPFDECHKNLRNLVCVEENECAFDERQPVDKEDRNTTSRIPSEIFVAPCGNVFGPDEIPVCITIRKSELNDDDISNIPLEDCFLQKVRPLTPRPSFEETSEQTPIGLYDDCPSDEGNFVYCPVISEYKSSFAMANETLVDFI
jgi:hypothetical protein